VRGTLWSRFDLILYIFECHSPTDGSDETEIEAAADAAPSPNGKKKQKKKGGSSTPSPAPSSGIGRRVELLPQLRPLMQAKRNLYQARAGEQRTLGVARTSLVSHRSPQMTLA